MTFDRRMDRVANILWAVFFVCALIGFALFVMGSVGCALGGVHLPNPLADPPEIVCAEPCEPDGGPSWCPESCGPGGYGSVAKLPPCDTNPPGPCVDR